MKLPENPTAFDVARKVICDAFDLKAAGDLGTLDMLLEAADHTVGCGYGWNHHHADAWKRADDLDDGQRAWWQRYLAADDVRDCLVEADIKRNKAECRRRDKQARRKRKP